MKFAVIVPAHNEEAFLPRLFESLVRQHRLPDKLILVDDNSSDNTAKLMEEMAHKHAFVEWVSTASRQQHQPGAKVVEAFNYGLQFLKTKVEVLIKLDADLELPPSYFSKVIACFKTKSVGIAGGYCYEKNKAGKWVLNHPMNRDHVRGAFKAYRMACFKSMGGLRPAMGWDTVDELLARHNGYEVVALTDLKVRHHRPLGKRYTPLAAREQGKAFYQMRYGLFWSGAAIVKNGWKKKSVVWMVYCLQGYFRAKQSQLGYMVNEAEGKFIRSYRRAQLLKRIKKGW